MKSFYLIFSRYSPMHGFLEAARLMVPLGSLCNGMRYYKVN